MIFATCGTSHLPFDRMMEALRALPTADLHVQHGPAVPPPCARADAYLPFGTLVQRIEQADIVVCHAGVGSILCALRAGHMPIVFPKMKRFGEIVDDHQSELAEALADRGTVLVARTQEELVAAVQSVPARGTLRTFAAERLGAAVRAAVRGDAPIPQAALTSSAS